MNVVITLEQRFEGTPDGAVWSPGPFGYPFWLRYLDVFDHVQVVARVCRVADAAPRWVRADGPGVSFAPVTYYLGPWQYLRRRRRVLADVRGVLGPSDAVILRVGSQIADCLEPQIRRGGRPYGVEVVGDPYDVFAPGSVEHPLRPFFRWWFSRQLRRQCACACATAYVTEHALQRRYPPRRGEFSTSYSSVELPDAAFKSPGEEPFSTHYSDVELAATAFVPSNRPRRDTKLPFRLVAVGTLEQLYKAPDVLLDAIGECSRDGVSLELTWIGGGKHQPQLETRARALGLGSRVRFLGQVPAGEAVRAELDQADVFVLPSRQEGLPRAIIEAMARGLPCISSTVGGIPELLEAEDLVPPGDVGALAVKIREVVTDPERMVRASARNLEKAGNYREEVLRERRTEFYRQVKERTQSWIDKGGNR
ncbi:MAG TPA: glycosyltransferase family 4 protein [Isosphaeraceae bacterium]|nr:glycosyltransferase family 4 protein [Isosphaeraceae bacterium]